MTDEFSLTNSDLKHYPHFDAPLSLKKIEQLVTDRGRVASNSFYPFFLYHEEWQPYRSAADPAKPEKKSRPIRYGARRDAYIFAHYRRKLAVLYEQRLSEMGIADCPIAYRQIPKPGSNGGTRINLSVYFTLPLCCPFLRSFHCGKATLAIKEVGILTFDLRGNAQFTAFQSSFSKGGQFGMTPGGFV